MWASGDASIPYLWVNVTVKNFTWFRIFLIFLLLDVSASAQHPVIRQYTIENGLPSNVLYHSIQDHLGYIWLATESGISRFDGLQFENFTDEDEMPDVEVLGLYEDSQHRIWFRTFNGRVGFYLNGSFHHAENDPWLAQIDFSSMIMDIYEDAQHNIWFASQIEGIKCLTPEGAVFFTDYREFPHPMMKPFFAEDKMGRLQLFSRINSLSRPGAVTCWVKPGEKSVLCDFDPANFDQKAIAILFRKGAPPRLLEPDIVLPSPALGHIPWRSLIYWDGEQTWSYGSDAPLLKLNDPSVSEQTISLAEVNASHVMKDLEGNIWATTLDRGLIMLPANDVLVYDRSSGLSDDIIYSVVVDSFGTIFCGTNNGKVNVIRNGEITEIDLNPVPGGKNDRMLKLALDDSNRLWCISDRNLACLDQFDLTDRMILPSRGGKDLCFTPDNVFLATSTSLLSLGSRKSESHWRSRFTAIEYTSDDLVWLGSVHGLYYFDGEKANRFQPANQDFKHTVTDLIELQEGALLIATNGNGLFILEGDQIRRITKEEGLTSNTIRSLFVDHEKRIWISTNAGISLVQFTGNQKVRKITTADGLTSNDVKSCFVTRDGRLFVATAKGLSSLTLPLDEDTYLPPSVYIKDLKVNGQTSASLEPFNFDQNNLEWTFTGLSFKSEGDVRFKYRLKNWDKAWNYTRNPTVRYSSLPPGKYEFEVVALAKDGTPSRQPVVSSVEILPHFSQTWWFRAALGILVLSIIGVSVWLKFRQVKRANTTKMQLLELEQKALLSQMNPHFIYNSLSSIQYFIVTNEKRLANRYLSNFSQLIRDILGSSRSPVIGLDKEINMLELYLQLEVLRYGQELSYELVVPPIRNKALFHIPTMMIQPIVENAIIHGVGGVEGRQGKVSLIFDIDTDYLTCTIEDNGKGRPTEPEKGIAAHRGGTALKIIRERLELLQHSYPQSELEIVDLKDEQSQPLGTRVILRLPFLSPHKMKSKAISSNPDIIITSP